MNHTPLTALWCRWTAKDEAAYIPLHNALTAAARRIVRRTLGWVDEIAVETAVDNALFARKPPTRNCAAWFYRVAVNAALARRRQTAREVSLEAAEGVAVMPTVERGILAQELLARLGEPSPAGRKTRKRVYRKLRRAA